ncbi:penicillin-binding protein 1C [Aureisphaera galaxeae]|uniref:penicillin-binding protein 1C n=1 Tax=Aureisphaera galaxeae TaxID=1538023 RepID=UPI0023500BBD|nr:penicillin-binding protein 1C [Aureisphaera galaxeae]MDC8005267.1 penicillin-binding protein 1C [Aureisphaera galaxeae]
MSVLFVVWLFCLPKPLFQNPTSTVVESREGVLLGARIANDGQWRFPAMDSIPYRFEQSIIHFEDEYFYTHPGFNPVSMAKALWQNMTTETRRGGSTLTQQVIRLARKNKERSYFEKAIELFMATRLEAGYSKEEILNFYASYAPFGGNVVGLETASWRYFGIPSSELSWGQSASLAVLPNAPSLIFPGKNEELLRAKRDRLLLKLHENEIIDATTYELALEEALPGKPMPLPQLAPHLLEKIRSASPGERISTTVEANLQQKVNRISTDHHYQLKQNEIHNLAVLILDVNTREVLAYIGNAPTDKENNRFVDIVDKPRSTGSILKPFLYAAALEGGDLLPKTLMTDVPTTINGYSPKNFNNRFDGAVPADEALSRSLNIPAVRSLQQYGLERFYQRLQEINLKQINKSPHYYGLSLILGGAESSLWEITQAYAGMASSLNHFNDASSTYREFEFSTPTFIKDEGVSFGEEQFQPVVFDAGSIYKTFEALKGLNRPEGEENWQHFTNSQSIAWKTGTSFGFKDAWAVGVTPKYAVGVWVGNADGEGRPGLTGIQAAAPLLFDVFDALPKSEGFAIPYDALLETEVCTKSGHLAGIFCDHVETDFIPEKGIRTEPCPYHKQIFVDASERYQVNSSCYDLSEMKQKQWFSLSPVQEYYYTHAHPEYRPLPPFKLDCLREGEKVMEFIFPKANETILLAKDFDTQVNEIVLQLAHRSPETRVYWYLNDTFLGTTQTFHEWAFTPLPGEYILTAVDEEGNEVKQRIVIANAS